MFITGVNDTGEKLFSSVNDTGKTISPCHGFSVIAGVVDTGDKFIVDTGDQLSAVTTTPAINLSPVTRTRTPWRWGAAKVEGYKSAISPAAEVGNSRRWCHWNRHEKLHP